MALDFTKIKIRNAWANTKPAAGSGITEGSITLVYTDEAGKRQIGEVYQDWYFFIENTDDGLSSAKKHLKALGMKGYSKGGHYIKIIIPKISYESGPFIEAIKKMEDEDKILTYEADLGPMKRYLLDHDAKIEDFSKINLMYFDIETDDSDGNIEYEKNQHGKASIKAKDAILSFAAVDTNGKEYFFYNKGGKNSKEAYAAEGEFLMEVNDFLQEKEVDMLVGWNSKDFDIPYLTKRMRWHKIPSSYMYNILHEDMMKRLQYFYMKDPEARQKLTSYSLRFVSQYFLGESKVEFDGGVKELYDKDFTKFKEYNIQDCRLLKKLEDKLGLIKLTYLMFQMCQTTAQNWSMVKTLDNFILSEATKKGVHYKTNKSYHNHDDIPEDGEEYLGAFVLDPVPGYYEDVYDLDFKSLYPNIIRSFNISPETNLGTYEWAKNDDLWKDFPRTPGVEIDGVMKGKVMYSAVSATEGVIPFKITLLLEEREKIRSEQKKFAKDSAEYRDLNVKQLVVKEMANSIYGVIGNKYFRGFDVDMAESITATGQYLSKHLQAKYNEEGRKVIYGDTDSIFVIPKEGEKVEDLIDETNKYLKIHLKQFGVKNCTIQLAYDKKFDKFLILSKKKYSGVTEGKIIHVGMECIKRDTIPVARNYQIRLIERIFNNDTEDNIRKWIEEKKETVMNADFKLEDIQIHKRMSKDASEYKSKAEGKKYTAPIHVRIANSVSKKGEDKMDLRNGGSIISFVVTTHSPSIDGIHVSEFKGEWDRTYYWNNLIYPPLMRILEVVYPKMDWLQYDIIEKKKPNAKKDRLIQEAI